MFMAVDNVINIKRSNGHPGDYEAMMLEAFTMETEINSVHTFIEATNPCILSSGVNVRV